MQVIKRKLFAYRDANLQNDNIDLSSDQKSIFQTQIKTSNFKSAHQSKSQFSKRNSHHQNFLSRKLQHPNTQNKSSKTNLKRASTLKCREKENDDFLFRTTNQNGFKSKIKNFYEDKFDTKEDNFLTPSQFINTKDSKIKRSLHKIGVHSSATMTPTNQITLESKWLKIIELYTMRDQLAKKLYYTSISQLKKKYPILPSGQFYRIMIKDRVFQKEWKINFPETIFLDTDGNVVMVYTDPQTGILKKKFIEKQGKQKDRYKEQVLKFKTDFIESLHKTNKMRLFKDLRLQTNPNAPLSIMKYTQNDSFQFQTDVQSDRNFNERKLRPTRDSIVQKYIYSNNLKAMVFRLYYRKQNQGNPSVPEYEGVRFENQKPIFKESGQTNFAQIHKLTSTITLSEKRINTIKVMKINNMKALEKFIVISKEVQKMLEYVEKVVIDKLYVDFIVDVFDKPWVINIKYCQINPNSVTHSQQPKQDHIRNVSSCRLCGVVERKQKLKNTVSVRMLCEFIYHLKKRTRQEELHKIDFIQSVNINSKENKTSNVCKICYNVIINELELMKMEKRLAQICNIVPQSGQELMEGENNKCLKNNGNLGQYKQWRLMLYFQNIKNNHQLSDNHYGRSRQYNDSSSPYQQKAGNKGQGQYYLRYQLCPKLTQSFECHKQSRISNNLSINQVKLHYFYSQTTNIQEFINNTEIIVSLYSLQESQSNKPPKTIDSKLTSSDIHHIHHDRKDNQKFDNLTHTEKLIASGSTHILSTFNLYKSSSFSLKALMENGQKQTATVLLFFQNKKYCQLTLKVGLVYDGSYNVSNIPSKRENSGEMQNFIKWNEVWFSKNRWNSNPLPKEWMEIFGSKYNYNSGVGVSHEDIKEQQNQEKMIKKMLENQTVSLSDDFDL